MPFNEAKDLVGFDVGKHRPYLQDGKSLVSVRQPGGMFGVKPSEIPARYTKKQWMEMDRLTVNTFREVAELTNRLEKIPGIVFNPQPPTLPETTLDKPSFEDEDLSRPIFQLKSLPLPITHADCDERGAEEAARAVAEQVEKTVIAAFLDHPRIKKCSAKDACSVLGNDKYYGPYIAHIIPDLGILVVVAHPVAIQIVVGLDVVPVQWEDHLKVMCIIVPNVREDYHGRIGAVLAQ